MHIEDKTTKCDFSAENAESDLFFLIIFYLMFSEKGMHSGVSVTMNFIYIS